MQTDQLPVLTFISVVLQNRISLCRQYQMFQPDGLKLDLKLSSEDEITLQDFGGHTERLPYKPEHFIIYALSLLSSIYRIVSRLSLITYRFRYAEMLLKVNTTVA